MEIGLKKEGKCGRKIRFQFGFKLCFIE